MSTSQEGSAEHRRSLRRRTLLSAVVRQTNLLSTWQCVVRNMSETGARLEIPNGAFLPDRFVLDIPVRAIRVPSAVVWREPAAVGVRFVEETPETVDQRALERLRQENSALKARMSAG
jgi:hypothetical protein